MRKLIAPMTPAPRPPETETKPQWIEQQEAKRKFSCRKFSCFEYFYMGGRDQPKRGKRKSVGQ